MNRLSTPPPPVVPDEGSLDGGASMAELIPRVPSPSADEPAAHVSSSAVSEPDPAGPPDSAGSDVSVLGHGSIPAPHGAEVTAPLDRRASSPRRRSRSSLLTPSEVDAIAPHLGIVPGDRASSPPGTLAPVVELLEEGTDAPRPPSAASDHGVRSSTADLASSPALPVGLSRDRGRAEYALKSRASIDSAPRLEDLPVEGERMRSSSEITDLFMLDPSIAIEPAEELLDVDSPWGSESSAALDYEPLPVAAPDPDEASLRRMFYGSQPDLPELEDAPPGPLRPSSVTPESRGRSAVASILATGLQSVPWGVIIADRTGRVRFANRAATFMYGGSGDSLVGAHFAASGAFDLPGGANAALQLSLRTGFWSKVVSWTDGEGEIWPVRFSICREGDGGLGTYVVITVESVHREYQAEQDKLQMHRMAILGRMTGDILDELTGPMRIAIESAHQVYERVAHDATDDATRLAARDAFEAVERMRRVLQGVRTVSRETVCRRQCALDAAVSPSLIVLQSMLRDGIRVVTPQEAGPVVNADLGRVSQVVMDLMKNAVEAMVRSREGDTITITYGVLGPHAWLSVRDNGPGFDASDIRDLFTRPVMTDHPSGRRVGFGLVSCRRLLEQDGGRLELVNSSRGDVEFKIFLPRIRGSQPSPGSLRDTAPAEAPDAATWRGSSDPAYGELAQMLSPFALRRYAPRAASDRSDPPDER